MKGTLRHTSLPAHHNEFSRNWEEGWRLCGREGTAGMHEQQVCAASRGNILACTQSEYGIGSVRTGRQSMDSEEKDWECNLGLPIWRGA